MNQEELQKRIEQIKSEHDSLIKSLPNFSDEEMSATADSLERTYADLHKSIPHFPSLELPEGGMTPSNRPGPSLEAPAAGDHLSTPPLLEIPERMETLSDKTEVTSESPVTNEPPPRPSTQPELPQRSTIYLQPPRRDEIPEAHGAPEGNDSSWKPEKARNLDLSDAMEEGVRDQVPSDVRALWDFEHAMKEQTQQQNMLMHTMSSMLAEHATSLVEIDLNLRRHHP